MTGRRYYLTTLSAWNHHAGHFANSHWLLLGSGAEAEPSDSSRVLVLVEADEGVHLQLETDSSYEALPPALAQKPISETAQSALAGLGVAPGATTFDAGEVLGRLHPLLRHRVF